MVAFMPYVLGLFRVVACISPSFLFMSDLHFIIWILYGYALYGYGWTIVHLFLALFVFKFYLLK